MLLVIPLHYVVLGMSNIKREMLGEMHIIYIMCLEQGRDNVLLYINIAHTISQDKVTSLFQ